MRFPKNYSYAQMLKLKLFELKLFKLKLQIVFSFERIFGIKITFKLNNKKKQI